jgi:hypothetical protein
MTQISECHTWLSVIFDEICAICPFVPFVMDEKLSGSESESESEVNYYRLKAGSLGSD